MFCTQEGTTGSDARAIFKAGANKVATCLSGGTSTKHFWSSGTSTAPPFTGFSLGEYGKGSQVVLFVEG